MKPSLRAVTSRLCLCSVLPLAALVQVSFGAEAARPAAATGQRAPVTVRSGPGGRGALPDPVLLDGSTHAAEKKSEYGMIGDFELPGDENAKSGKVGGGKSGGDESQQNDGQGGGGGLPGAAKQGAGGGSAGPQAKAAGGQDPNAPDKPGGGGGEPGAKAEGIKVAELGGDPSGGGAGDDASKKPSPVAIGDKAMRIPQSTPSTAGVVGAQQVANQNTQVYEKPTGTGGKAPTGPQGPNRTEKGRTIPPGL